MCRSGAGRCPVAELWIPMGDSRHCAPYWYTDNESPRWLSISSGPPSRRWRGLVPEARGVRFLMIAFGAGLVGLNVLLGRDISRVWRGERVRWLPLPARFFKVTQQRRCLCRCERQFRSVLPPGRRRQCTVDRRPNPLLHWGPARDPIRDRDSRNPPGGRDRGDQSAAIPDPAVAQDQARLGS